MKNKTFRIFSLVCYDTSDTLPFNEILTLCNKYSLNYAYIKHFSESTDTKDHYHFMIYYEQPTTLKKVSQTLMLDENYLKVLDDFGNRYTLKKTIGYFLHYNNNSKIQYEFSDIVSNIPDIVEKYYNILTGGKNEKSELNEIIAFVEENHPSTKELLKFCLENEYLKTFKKYSYILHNICLYER